MAFTNSVVKRSAMPFSTMKRLAAIQLCPESRARDFTAFATAASRSASSSSSCGVAAGAGLSAAGLAWLAAVLVDIVALEFLSWGA